MTKKKICIIGSGLTGTLLAAELLERTKHEIIVIDIDKLNEKFFINEEHFNYYPFERFKDVLTFSLGFGGSSNLWHGVMTDFDKIDNERLKNNFGLNKLCESNMTSLSYKIFPGIDKFISISDDLNCNKFWRKKLYYVPRKPWRFRETLKDLKRKFSKKLTIFEDTVAVDMNIEDIKNHAKVVSLNVISDLKKRKIKADTFICSLGALETPRLLNQTFWGNRFLSTNCGLNLLDHPFASIGNIVFNRKILSTNGHPGFFSKYKKREGLCLVKLINNRNSSINLVPNILSLKDQFLNLKSVQKDKIYKLSAASVPFTTKMIFNYVRTDSYKIICHHEVLNIDNGYIKNTDSKDEFGRKIPKFNYPNTLSFFESVEEIKSKNLLSNFYRDTKKIEIFENREKIKISPASHYAGTCYASKFDKDSVCDENFKVRNSTNLYVADASVLPIIGNSNLSITLSKVAKIVADNLINL